MSVARGGSNRLVVYISDENFLALQSASILPGDTKPRFGMNSRIVNQLLDSWRVQLARKELSDGPDTNPHP